MARYPARLKPDAAVRMRKPVAAWVLMQIAPTFQALGISTDAKPLARELDILAALHTESRNPVPFFWVIRPVHELVS